MDARATYVYCVARASTKPRVSRMPAGLPGATPPRLVDAGDSLWIVCASVPLTSYGPGVLDASLRDLTWVGEIAVSHESVVEHVAQQKNVTVVPMKLFTMFSSDDRAREAMRSRRREILGVTRRIAGCEEWGVRITRKPPAARIREKAADRSASGAAFLTAKKEARDLSREVIRVAAESADHAYATLSAIARAARRRDDAPEGAAAPPLLDAAFLVPAGRRSRFKAAARKLAVAGTRTGTEITVTGPWPAYNFVQEPARP
jgi:hypothetical protein